MIIKKLNTVFHKHSKILFGAFTLIIIVSFIGFTGGGSMFGCDSHSGGNQKVGEAYGKKVTMDDLQDFYRKCSIVMGDVNLDWQGVFYLYCLNLRADRLGIVVSDDEVAKAISFYGMDKDGKYDANKYQKHLSDLKKRGISENDLAEAVRLSLKQQKLREYVFSQVVVTPSEVAAVYRDFNTMWHFKVASFSSESVAAPNPKDLAKYYADEKNKGRYRCVKLVEFPVAGDKGDAARKRAESFIREVRKAEADKRAAAFDEVAKKFKVKVRERVWVCDNGENSGGLTTAGDLGEKVFSVTLRNPLTQPIVGAKAVYVGCLLNPPADKAVVEAKKLMEKHWRLEQAQKLAAEDAEALNKKADGEREKAFFALKKTRKAGIADFTFAKIKAVPQLTMYSQLMRLNNQLVKQIYPRYLELANQVQKLPGVQKGFVVALPSATGANVYLLVKREFPPAAMSKEDEAICRERCFEQKAQAAWLAFEEDIRSNCKFVEKKEGQR